MISFRLWWRASTILSCPNTAVWRLCDKSCRSPSARASIRFIFLKKKATPIFLSNRQRRRPKFPPSLLYFRLVILFFLSLLFVFVTKARSETNEHFVSLLNCLRYFLFICREKKKEIVPAGPLLRSPGSSLLTLHFLLALSIIDWKKWMKSISDVWMPVTCLLSERAA